tara:strand:+ start:173 stop:478 length:306 start_codon:yes stop_codon:yes gene_type:complete
MAAAVSTLHLDAMTVGVGEVLHGSIDLFIEGRPTAVGVEFVNGAVEFGVAPAAGIGAVIIEVVILAGEGPFSPFVLDDVFLFVVELVVVLIGHVISSGSDI